jgi:hypothetical protein
LMNVPGPPPASLSHFEMIEAVSGFAAALTTPEFRVPGGDRKAEAPIETAASK